MAGFAFILAGYGTKMGLSPFHTWLPDAHSEAPAPVSALLSGALLNCSFFAIVRFREIMPDGASLFCDLAMLSLGLLSVAVGAVFMVRQTDYKRLLAYSSVEHIGLITVLYSLYSNFASQKLVMAAILLHIAAHSLTKTMLFQLAGNLLLAFQTRAISVVQGLGEVMKKEAALWVSGFILICGMPPSALLLQVCLPPRWVSPVTAPMPCVLVMSGVPVTPFTGRRTFIRHSGVSRNGTSLFLPRSCTKTVSRPWQQTRWFPWLIF
jgi:hydrogenase-4 component F